MGDFDSVLESHLRTAYGAKWPLKATYSSYPTLRACDFTAPGSQSIMQSTVLRDKDWFMNFAKLFAQKIGGVTDNDFLSYIEASSWAGDLPMFNMGIRQRGDGTYDQSQRCYGFLGAPSYWGSLGAVAEQISPAIGVDSAMLLFLGAYAVAKDWKLSPAAVKTLRSNSEIYMGGLTYRVTVDEPVSNIMVAPIRTRLDVLCAASWQQIGFKVLSTEGSDFEEYALPYGVFQLHACLVKDGLLTGRVFVPTCAAVSVTGLAMRALVDPVMREFLKENPCNAVSAVGSTKVTGASGTIISGDLATNYDEFNSVNQFSNAAKKKAASLDVGSAGIVHLAMKRLLSEQPELAQKAGLGTSTVLTAQNAVRALNAIGSTKGGDAIYAALAACAEKGSEGLTAATFTPKRFVLPIRASSPGLLDLAVSLALDDYESAARRVASVIAARPDAAELIKTSFVSSVNYPDLNYVLTLPNIELPRELIMPVAHTKEVMK